MIRWTSACVLRSGFVLAYPPQLGQEGQRVWLAFLGVLFDACLERPVLFRDKGFDLALASTTSRRATVCTRPADRPPPFLRGPARPPLTRRHSRGLTL